MTLESRLRHELAVWRTELGDAAAGIHRLAESEVVDRRVTVLVRYSGDIEALRQAGLDTGYDSGDMVTGIISLADVEQLDAVPGVDSVALLPPSRPTLDKTVKEMRVPWKVPPDTPWPGRGAGVIIGVVDTGIDIFHESFRNADAAKTTRILELWDQSPTATGGSPPPAGFQQIGRVYKPTDINAALAAGPPFTSTDTDGHGTHVAGIAAGDGSQVDNCAFPGTYVGVAPDADLVVVKAIGVTPNNEVDAVRWCAQAGSRNPGNKPVVVNCSFGSDTGPHDGTDTLCVGVDPILRPTAGPVPAGVAVVVAAGNSGGHEVRESGTIAANGSVTVPFTVRDGSKKMDLLDIWYTGAASLTVELVAPPNPAFPGTNTTGPVAPVAPGTPARKPVIGGMTLTITSETGVFTNNKRQINITITVPAGKEVRNGPWQLKLTNTTAVPADWNAWFHIEHDDPSPTFRLATEANRVEKRRENTIESPGTSRNVITVANYDDSNSTLAETSSRGVPTQPVAPPGEIKPTLAAPGTAVTAARSRDDKDSNSSCCDQQVVDKFGTSMASPHVAGLVALMFQKNKTLTFEQVRAHLQVTCRTDGIPAAEVPPPIEAPPPGDPTAPVIHGNHLWGSGKANAAAALASIPAAPAVAASGGGGDTRPLAFAPEEIGLTPHTYRSRLADLQRRFGARPGLQLFASLVSEHVDEALRLVNTNRRVLVVWRRLGGPQLVRRLLHGPAPNETLLPKEIEGRDVGELIGGFLAILDRFAGPRLRADIARFTDFVRLWPGASLDMLDEAALGYGAGEGAS